MDQRFAGIERLYGSGSVATFARAHVCVVGIGGVGSWAVEAFARSGIGALTLIDADEICVSNTNRQAHAITGQYGRSKVAAMAERARAINPALRVHSFADFLASNNLAELLDRGYHGVLDACDAFRVKVEMIVFCKRRKIPLVVCGAAGGRVDPTLISVRDLSRTDHDIMLGQIRRKLRDEFGWTRNPKRYFGIPAVFSREHARYVQADGSVRALRPADAESGLKLDCAAGFGAATHVTASFAFVAVARMLDVLLERAESRADRADG